MSKIQDNPSYNKLRTDIEGAKALRKVFKVASIFSSKAKEGVVILDKMIAMKPEIEDIASMPDRFNEHFSKLGWIAHETMNAEIMSKAVNLADGKMISEAESLLVEYYCSEQTAYNVIWLKNIPAFFKRYELISYARIDTLEERYYSCIPLLLMIIDGGVNDIDKSKGFFTNGSDLTAWDSIAAHSTGLSVIREIFNKSVKKTNSESITIPYRNGILHGRELGYANRIVAAKCWATLFAIYDWATIIKNGKKNPPEPKPKITWRAILDRQQKTKKLQQEIEKWKPRAMVIGKDIPYNSKPSDYDFNTPERTAVEFVNYWQCENYGYITNQLYLPVKDTRSNYNEVKNIRRILEDTKLKFFQITAVDDQAPAISEVTMIVRYEYQDKLIEHELTLRYICQHENGDASLFGDEYGKWYCIDSFLYDIESKCIQATIDASAE